MAKKKMLFIYNQKAGKGQIRNHLSDVIDIVNMSRISLGI